MSNNSKILYVEINDHNFIFYIGETDVQNNFKVIHKSFIPLAGIEDGQIAESEKIFNIIKENVYIIEQKFDYTFKETILIIENFRPSFLNLSEFKKLNGSQVLRENITYILNTLKAYVDEIEKNKTVLHIFNSKFYLDKKKIENLPVGLFGDFYSHELSFILINSNDYKNLKYIFDKCNLKINKIILKSFIKGANLSEKNNDIETFYQVRVNKEKSKIFIFENNSLKFEQDFKFGFNVVIRDICKITSLSQHTVKNVIENLNFNKEISDDEIIEKEFFKDNNYRKIKKKLILQIIEARVSEILDLMILKNVNLKFYNKTLRFVFLEFNSEWQLLNLRKTFKDILLNNDISEVKFLNNVSNDEIINTANTIVHFGWKKEAIPVTGSQKSLIARFFEAIFG